MARLLEEKDTCSDPMAPISREQECVGKSLGSWTPASALATCDQGHVP